MPRSKNEWSCTSTPQYAFMSWCSVRGSTGDRDNFTEIYEARVDWACGCLGLEKNAYKTSWKQSTWKTEKKMGGQHGDGS
jgi:hypothetical protein